MAIREYTNKIIDLVDQGVLDADYLMRQLLLWMSEDDVREFYKQYYEEEFDEDDEDDGQPSEMDEWLDYDPGC